MGPSPWLAAVPSSKLGLTAPSREGGWDCSTARSLGRGWCSLQQHHTQQHANNSTTRVLPAGMTKDISFSSCDDRPKLYTVPGGQQHNSTLQHRHVQQRGSFRLISKSRPALCHRFDQDTVREAAACRAAACTAQSPSCRVTHMQLQLAAHVCVDFSFPPALCLVGAPAVLDEEATGLLAGPYGVHAIDQHHTWQPAGQHCRLAAGIDQQGSGRDG